MDIQALTFMGAFHPRPPSARKSQRIRSVNILHLFMFYVFEQGKPPESREMLKAKRFFGRLSVRTPLA